MSDNLDLFIDVKPKEVKPKKPGGVAAKIIELFIKEQGKWFTLWDIQARIGGGAQTAISARLREMGRYGCKMMARQRDNERGVWDYTVEVCQ